MNQRKLAINELHANGYELKRNGGNHDIYYNPDTGRIIPLKRGHFTDKQLRYIIKEIHSGH